MIERICLKFGSQSGSLPLEFKAEALTVFVGPNNSGKSLVLREMEQIADSASRAQTEIISKVQPQKLSADAAEHLYRRRQAKPDNRPLPNGVIWVQKFAITGQQLQPARQVDLDQMRREIAKNDHSSLLTLISVYTLGLDGKTRLSLTQPQPLGDLTKQPANYLTALFKDESALGRLRSMTYDAFKLYFVTDPTDVGRVRVRLSPREPIDSEEEKALSDRAIQFHSRAAQISEFSDGVNAYTGLIAAVLSSDYRVVLIDEPEAFLHPPLIRKLGRNLAELAKEREGNVFASTHSSDFLMGVVQSGVSVNIVRLTYKEKVPTARLLAGDEVQKLMRDPLLRSTGVLNALFHEGAVVCEGDTDRAFYQEINERLLFEKSGGADGCLFLNAHGKEPIRRIVEPLRKMGIPAAAIVDIDIIKGDDAKDLQKAAFVPEGILGSLGVLRGNVCRYFTMHSREMKSKGIELLSNNEKAAAQSLIDQLAEYGIFVVPNGEVESWLRYMGIADGASSKRDWLPRIFERMGVDHSDSNYVKPDQGDVWDFLRKVGRWIAHPNRKGMPS
ncbi:MAG TPA: AAA family ATPase [Candidatus Binataceae bacterium]|nr:AAA family ATPase [Candidatus Binataceae bacterium]